MSESAEEAKAQARIKQLEIGHDEWRTHAHRAEAEVERLREDLDELALRVVAYRAAPIDARDDPRSWSNLGKLLMACDNIQRHREGEKP